MSQVSDLLFWQCLTAILLVATLSWTVVFGILAFRHDGPRYRRSTR